MADSVLSIQAPVRAPAPLPQLPAPSAAPPAALAKPANDSFWSSPFSAIGRTLGQAKDQLTSYGAGLMPGSHAKPPVTIYAGDPKSLREGFDAIPGGGPARTRQFSRNVESWASTWDMLGRANKSIDTTYFIVERDIFGFSFLGSLMRKQRAGVPVRMMTDATADFNGKHGFTDQVALAWPPQLGGKDYLQELAGSGAQVAVYHPLWQHITSLPEAALLGTSSIAATNHDKILVVDGQISKTGGRNIAWDYFADPADKPEAWRDGDSEIRGPAQAASMTLAFEREFNSKVASHISPDRFGNWVKRDIELLGAYHLMDLWMHEPALSEAECAALRADAPRRSAMADDLVKRAVAALPAEGITRTPSQRELDSLKAMATELVGYTRTRGASTTYDRDANFYDAEVKIVDQTSQASGRYNEIAPALTNIVRGSQSRIIIENPYVVLTEQEIQELERASKNGVEILFGTNSPLSTDSSVTQAFFLQDWAYILARVPTARFFVATGTHKFHDKMAVADGQVSLVSSYNADWLSAYVNSEIADISWSKQRASSLTRSFVEDYNDPANKVLEYKIKRNPDGSAVLVDKNAGTGKAPDWQPVIEFGPENHLPANIIADYAKRKRSWDWRRKFLPQLAPLTRPPLTYPAVVPGKPKIAPPALDLAH
jgi:phosphatidylserine/phosphatidylglycerophosphate/cardiolipin synthase-like enzyme